MEGQIALGSLLARFPHLALAVPPEQLHWRHGDGLVLRGLSELPVIPGPARDGQAPAPSPRPEGVTGTTPAAGLRPSFLEDATGTSEAQELFEDDKKVTGYVTNASRLWARLPAALNGLADLMAEAVRAGALSLAQRSVLVTAAASAMRDSYCSLAWGKKLAGEVGADVAATVIQGGTDGLGPVEKALAHWARQVATGPSSTTVEDVQHLREVGFDDDQIFAITAFVAFRLAFATVNDALGALPDHQLAGSTPEQVRDAVTFGRPLGSATDQTPVRPRSPTNPSRTEG